MQRANSLLPQGESNHLDRLLRANAAVLPERAGAGANHYPMAAEAMEAMGFAQRIPEFWSTGANGYSGVAGRQAPLQAFASPDTVAALGDYDRYGDWLDLFRRELSATDWQRVVSTWSQRLAPGLVGGLFHGLLRTAHATRALRAHPSPERMDELAIGLAYWAARYTELPAGQHTLSDHSFAKTLAHLDFRWKHDDSDLGFDEVPHRLRSAPIAPSVDTSRTAPSQFQRDLNDLVRSNAQGFLEMLVQERNRLWLLHTLTAPASLGLLAPSISQAAAADLLAYSKQAVEAVWVAFGEPFEAGAHLRTELPSWSSLIERAVASQSIHGIKLIDSLYRFGQDSTDPIWKSVAVQWFEWT